LDGNGRIGRLLIPLYLIANKLLDKPSLYLSAYFERNRASYYDALMRVRESNDIIHWIRFFLTGVMETATKGCEVFRGILALRTETEKEVHSMGKRAANAFAALNYLFSQPVTTAADLTDALEISPPTAHTLVRELTKRGILNEVTGNLRGRVFSFERYLRLFAD
jgi:Fic family protein